MGACSRGRQWRWEASGFSHGGAEAGRVPFQGWQRQLGRWARPCSGARPGAAPHLLHAVTRVAVPGKHRLPHVLRVVRAPALDAARAVKVAVRRHHRLGGQARLMLQRVDVLDSRGKGVGRVGTAASLMFRRGRVWEEQGWRGGRREGARARGGFWQAECGWGQCQAGGAGEAATAAQASAACARACVKQRSSRPLSWSSFMKKWVGVGR